MKSTIVWGLILLNAALLISLASRLMQSSAAIAQQAPARRPGDYLMIPANVSGASTGIIVVVDQANSQLSAVSYDDSNRNFSTMSKIDLAAIFRQQQQPAPAPHK
jgi:hypothetical protein